MRTRRKPTVEFRIPISANERFLRMTHYFLESLRIHGGDITKEAKCVLSISRDEPKRDLYRDYPWLGEFAVDLRWVDGRFTRGGSSGSLLTCHHSTTQD
jgi:hypothetical protein